MICDNLIIFLLESGIGKLRADMFRKHIQSLKAVAVNTFNADVSHVVVDEKIDCSKLCRILKLSNCFTLQNVLKISTKWLSASIEAGKFVDSDDYKIKCSHDLNKCIVTTGIDYQIECAAPSIVFSDAKYSCHNNEVSKYKTRKYHGIHKFQEDISDEESVSHDNVGDSSMDEVTLPEKKDDTNTFSRKRKWICQFSSNSMKLNRNKFITDKLEELMEAYQNRNDKWRVLGYKKAIIAIKNYDSEITSYDEAKSIPGIGDRLAEKITEIIESGKLRKLDEITSQEQTQALKLFTDVWGAGPNAAINWVMQDHWMI